MVIQLDPKRINTGGLSRKPTARNAGQQQTPPEEHEIVVPRRAHVNYIPSPESLSTMVRSAVSALKRGVRWDRGTILNILT